MLLTKKIKSVIKVLLLVLLTVSGNILLANEEKANLTITKGNDKSFAISFDYQEEIDVIITFKDAFSVTLFKEDVKGIKNLSKTFDLNNLPDGVYFLEIENEMSIFSQMIEIKNDKMNYNEAGEYSINKPKSYVKEDSLYLSSQFSNETDVEVTIYNKLGEVVYDELLKNQKNLDKTFKFIEGQPNDYTISVRYNGRTFNL